MKLKLGILSATVFLCIPLALSYAQQPVVGRPVKFGVSPPLRSIKPVKPQALTADGGKVREIPLLPRPKPERAKEPELPEALYRDPAAQTEFPQLNAPAPDLTFEGLSNDDNVAVLGVTALPPDANGDVGPGHYVQAVNLVVKIFDKTGTPLLGPIRMSSLFVGLGTACDPQNELDEFNSDGGDPIVLYDHLADRWLLSQFTSGGPPFHQCIAISQTGDPTGAYFVYDFAMPGDKYNDYPKFGVWPDAYYMTDNQFSAALDSYQGVGAFAFDRAKMLVGPNPVDPLPSFIYFDLNTVDPFIFGMLPSDLDGPAPPAGTPNYFAYLTADALRIFEFHADFANPASSTFTERVESPIAVTAFDPIMACGFSGRDCIPQKDTGEKLDAISDRLMHRLQYRNFGTHESLVTNHTVDVGGSHAGVRYYELRRSLPGGSFAVNEQATFAPDDAAHRWMGSAAMDKDGNLAVGYSVSSETIFPSIRYAGRLATDPPGGLFQGEATLHAGGGSQTHASSRWGDYTMMAVDPVDDCTFWYTNEYYSETSALSWRTRIGSFRFPGCSAGAAGADLSISKTDSPDPVTVGNNLTYTLIATNGGPDAATGVVVTDTLPAGVAFVSSSTTQGTCTGTDVVTCDLGSLANGTSATLTIVVTPTAAGALTNTASVAGIEADPNTANNTATSETAVSPASCVGTGSFTISGKVRMSSRKVRMSPAVAVTDVALALSGPDGCTATATATRNSQGGYRFATLASGTYTVAPGKTGCTFRPSNRTVRISRTNRRANFTASCS